MKTLAIWTDGGCRVNPGIGGWGFWIPDFFNVKSFGYSRKTTNNAMEISAILEALKVVVKASTVHMQQSDCRVYSNFNQCVLHSVVEDGITVIEHGIDNIPCRSLLPLSEI